jgi:hypothetical protein
MFHSVFLVIYYLRISIYEEKLLNLRIKGSSFGDSTAAQKMLKEANIQLKKIELVFCLSFISFASSFNSLTFEAIWTNLKFYYKLTAKKSIG